MDDLDWEKVAFIRGLLAAFASNGQLVSYDEVRRLSRLNDEQMGKYLGAARRARAEGEPDFCAVVVGARGTPGDEWGDLANWPKECQRAHKFWADRKRMDNSEFEAIHGRLPAIPGLSKR
jgi:hypothetical protein